MTEALQVGDRVHAKWSGNGCYYPARIKSMSAGGDGSSKFLVCGCDPPIYFDITDLTPVS